MTNVALLVAHLSGWEETLPEKANKAAEAAATRLAGVDDPARTAEIKEWCEDFSDGFIEGVTSTRSELIALLRHPLALSFPTLTVELFLSGLPPEAVLSELRKVT